MREQARRVRPTATVLSAASTMVGRRKERFLQEDPDASATDVEEKASGEQLTRSEFFRMELDAAATG